MRLRLIVPFFTTVLALPAAFRQQLDIIPTFRADLVTTSGSDTPVRGTGTSSYARASSAYAISSATGYLAFVNGSNVPDLSVPLSNATQPAIPAAAVGVALRTGVALTALNRAADAFGPVWADDGGTPVRTADAAVGVSGSTDADKIDDQNAGAVVGIKQNITVANDSSKYYFTVWVACDSNKTFEMDIAFTGGGTPVNKIGHTHNCTSATMHKFSEALSNNAGGNTTATIYFYPAATNAADTGYVYLSRAEFYLSPVELSFDPLVGAGSDFTQAAETGGWVPTTSLAYADTATYCEWFWFQDGGTASGVLGRWERNLFGPLADENNWFQITKNTSDEIRVVVENSSAKVADISSSTTVSQRTWTHLCVVWDQASSTIKMYKNGAEVSYNAGDTAFPAGATMTDGFVLGGNGSNGAETVSGEFFFTDVNYYAFRMLSPTKINALYVKQKALRGY